MGRRRYEVLEVSGMGLMSRCEMSLKFGDIGLLEDIVTTQVWSENHSYWSHIYN